MAVLISYLIYILASLIVGAKMLMLWRRTRELPELTIGLAFVLGGALSHCAWLALGIAMLKGVPADQQKLIAMLGLGSVAIGTVCCGVGTLLIFRSDSVVTKVLLAMNVLVIAALYAFSFQQKTFGESMAFWWVLAAAVPIYAWGAIEAQSMARLLSKRVRIGLADPLVVDRMSKWGFSSVSVVVTVAIGLSARAIYGPIAPQWTGLLSSAVLLFGAGSIWLGFFPPTFHRERVMRIAKGA